MYTPDYSNSRTLYEERLRDAEKQRAHSQLVESALAYKRTHGEESISLLTIIAQRLHLKAQPRAEVEANDARHAHAV